MEEKYQNTWSFWTTNCTSGISGKKLDPPVRCTGMKRKISQSPCSRHRFPRAPSRCSAAESRTFSADDAAIGTEVSRQSAIKMSDVTDSEKTTTGSMKRMKRRMIVSSICGVKNENKSVERSEERNDIANKSKVKSDRNAGAKTTLSKIGVRRTTKCARGNANRVLPVIRVKTSPSSITQLTSNATAKVAGDNEDRLMSPDDNSTKKRASPKRRLPRRKTKAKGDELETPQPNAPAPTGLTAPTRISPLHCAFLDALKEWSPRLVAALSATNEAAFLNAMWSCFWRGYRAGFHASVRELETSSGLCMNGQ